MFLGGGILQEICELISMVFLSYVLSSNYSSGINIMNKVIYV